LELRFFGEVDRVVIHYHLVRRHLDTTKKKDGVIRSSLCNICRATTTMNPPVSYYLLKDGGCNLPHRMGAQIMHDAQHLSLPAYAVFDNCVFDLLDQPKIGDDIVSE